MSIGSDALDVGDIIVSTTSEFISGAIRHATGAPVSHTMLYIGDGDQVVEAIGEGVVFRPLADALASATVAAAFRHPDLTAEQRLRMRDFVGSHIDKPYNRWGIFNQAKFIINGAVCNLLSGEAYERCRGFYGRVYLGTASDETFFCSELIIAAYEAAGVPLTNTQPNWGTPGAIADLGLTGKLSYVGHLKAPPLPSSQGFRAVDIGGYGNGQGYSSRSQADAPSREAHARAGAIMPSTHPMQVAEIASEIAGAIMTRILDNQGDISWELDQLQGLKHPDNNPTNAGTATYATTTITVSGPRASTVFGLDKIYADFELTFQHNGQSLGNIQITTLRANDAAGAGLAVKANIMDEANSYARPPNTGRFAAIKVRFHYRFTSPVYGDLIAITDFVLYGDGTYDQRFRWTQR